MSEEHSVCTVCDGKCYVRGLGNCPVCKGTGEIVVKDIYYCKNSIDHLHTPQDSSKNSIVACSSCGKILS